MGCLAAVVGTAAGSVRAAVAAGAYPVLSLERGRTDLPKVALTFDGGSDAGDAEQILAVLAQQNVKATFFLTGVFVKRYPEIVRAIVAAGHEVGNHTWSHPHLTSWETTGRHDTLPRVDAALVRRELADTAAAFAAAAGRPLEPFWRSPFGEVNPEILHWAADAGWRHVGWSREERGGRRTLDSLDWVSDRGARNYLSPAQINARILSYDAGGAGLRGGIVLMHLATRRTDPAVAHLAGLIEQLRDRGYTLTTVGELWRDLDAERLTAALH